MEASGEQKGHTCTDETAICDGLYNAVTVKEKEPVSYEAVASGTDDWCQKGGKEGRKKQN
ncbi:hypothetical protein E2C01_024918 [Portunus trituberculatus]|uniref:Uncharacterized protein n=1 Tax=Portunus trituberculatus TaxID=210409 RepID=A0A5B7EF67_PORTR|nr:hypothetical protein [Portunus trituberculatus]